ncbi:MAG: tetratricopeptide repeat protein [Bacteroidales bacterium]|nr:tetratricopeptide repeat protein [Bacteroidales bacterium]
MKKNIVIIFLLLLAGFAFADDKLQLIEEANKSYSEDDFQNAIDLYEKVIGNGVESSELYFNLGNAYFKINEIPTAILYYEKAKKLYPSDEDIQFNLQIANSRIVDKIEMVPDIFYVKWWKNLLYTFSVDEWAMMSIVSFAILMMLLLIFLLSNIYWLRKASFWTGLIFVVFSLTTYLLANQKYNSFTRDHQAIVFSPTLTVKSSPSETGIDLFVIHEGSKVQITDHIGQWYEIEIANGSVGWIKEKDIRKI